MKIARYTSKREVGLLFYSILCGSPGLEVIKLEYKLRLKIKPIIALYFESENELKLYNLEARFLSRISESEKTSGPIHFDVFG